MYVAVIAVYESHEKVHIDSSESESFATMEAVAAHKGVKNVFRTIVDESVFVAYSNGTEVKVDIVYGPFGNPNSIDLIH